MQVRMWQLVVQQLPGELQLQLVRLLSELGYQELETDSRVSGTGSPVLLLLLA